MVDFRDRPVGPAVTRYDGTVIVYGSEQSFNRHAWRDAINDRIQQVRDYITNEYYRHTDGYDEEGPEYFRAPQQGPVVDSPFRRSDPPRPPFGRRAPAIPAMPGMGWQRYLPYIGIPLIAGEILDWYFRPPAQRWDGGGNWVKYHDCGKGNINGFNYYSFQFYPAFNCADGQAGGEVGTPIGNYPNPSSWRFDETLIQGFVYEVSPGNWRINNDVWWDRIAPSGQPTLPPQLRPVPPVFPPLPPGLLAPPGIYGPPDPNIERRLKPGIGTPLAPPPTVAPPPPLEVAPDFRIEVRPVVPGWNPGAAPAPGKEREPAPQPAPVLRPPSQTAPPPAPPKSNEKEKKVRVRGAQAAIIGFRILDGLSEIADMVEAVYASLPASIRRRVEAEERKRRGLGPRESLERPGDSLGQYGINGADWRLRALWRHWDSISAPEAVRNLIANHIEDAAYGRYHAARDRLRSRNLGDTLAGRPYRSRPL